MLSVPFQCLYALRSYSRVFLRFCGVRQLCNRTCVPTSMNKSLLCAVIKIKNTMIM